VTPEELAGVLAAAAVAMARRFVSGATMWCVSPAWPEHGRHLAVEFVHPVIVGKRALPARSVDPADVTDLLGVARTGDILALIGPSGPTADGLLRRARPRGLLSVALGPRPPLPSPPVDYLCTVDEPDLILAYHVLWELTHVVFEHPGLLKNGPATGPEACVACSDQALPAEIRTLRSEGTAEALIEGELRTIDVSLIDAARPGDVVLVHAGVAISPATEAAETS
jgi:hydrogenase maturation factor